MSITDRHPLPNTPATPRISAHADNRYGAVLSSLHGFWTARAAAIAGSNTVRRDAYSVVLFDHTVATPIVNDFASTPDQMLNTLLGFSTNGGTDFSLAIQRAQTIMEQSWSTERYVNIVSSFTSFPLTAEPRWYRFPVIIFLSDGECSISDNIMQDLCRTAVRLGYKLPFIHYPLFKLTRVLFANVEKRYRSMQCRSARMVLRCTCVAWLRLRGMRRTMRRETHSHQPLRLSCRRTRGRSIRCVHMCRCT